MLADDAAFAHALRRECRAAGRRADGRITTPSSRPRPRNGKNIAPRVAALLDVMQISRHPVGRERGHLHPPDLCRQRDRDRRSRGRQEGASPCAAPPSTRPRPRAVRARSRRFRATGDAGLSSFVGAEIAKSERPELTSAKIIVSGGRALQDGENFHAIIEPLADKLGAARRREPRRGRCGLCPQRLSGRPDRQDRRPRSLYRDRHLGRDPASRRA